MRLTTDSFPHGWIPEAFTCDGRDVSPNLAIEDAPVDAASLALIVDDPDAPGGVFTHWLVWNVEPTTTSIPEGAAPPGAQQGTNDFGVVGWSGPCPPRGGAHRYRFRLFALDRRLSLGPDARAKKLEHEVRSGVLATAQLQARYARRGTRVEVRATADPTPN